MRNDAQACLYYAAGHCLGIALVGLFIRLHAAAVWWVACFAAAHATAVRGFYRFNFMWGGNSRISGTGVAFCKPDDMFIILP